jgi:THO complex subunit 2
VFNIFRKYPNTELHGLLHYLLDRMSTGESLDLLVLKELLGRMGGCDTMLEVSHQQLEGLAGGRALRNEVMGAQVKDAVSKKAQKMLRDTMLSSGTAIPLLLFIAQCRSNIIYNVGSSQLKLISYLYDTCQDVLMQFTDFLVGGNSKGAEGMVEIFPPMRHLLGEVGLNVSVAFQLVRPLIRAALHYGEDPSAAPPELQNWHPYSNEMKDVVCQHLPAEVWTALSPELYLTFWSLSLYDVFVPKSKYDTEIRRLKDRYSELDIKPPPGEDRLTHKQRRSEMTKILGLTNTLKEEQEAQKKHVEIVTTMIKKHKDSYLAHVIPDSAPKSTENIMQHCVYHRVLMSPADAIFCSQFFLNLHSQETPGFSTIHFFDKTMKTLAPLIFCSTEYEAGFLGFYINDMLETCNR